MTPKCTTQLELNVLAFPTATRPAGNPDRVISRTKVANAPRARVVELESEAGSLESLLTFAQAARTLGISLRHFRRLVDAGKVAFVKVSERSPRIRPRDLQRFLDASLIKYSEVQS
jgi:excisionase family DNA binding protein